MAHDPEEQAKWREIMARHEQSGLSVPAFCAREGISKWGLYFQRRKRPRPDHAACSAAPVFVPVVVSRGPGVADVQQRVESASLTDDPSATGTIGVISLQLRCGRVMRLGSVPIAQLAELIKVIESAGEA